MHNRPRNRVVDEKELDEKRKKITKWNQLKNQIFEERKSGAIDPNQLPKLNNLILLAPEFSSFWNYRKEIITDQLSQVNSEEQKRDIYKKELALTEQVLSERHTKSYLTWHHRKWCIVHVPDLWQNELALTSKLLSYDNRNFHCWNYREFVIKLLNLNPNQELDYCYSLLTTGNEGVSNYSAYHYRSAMLNRKHEEQQIDFDQLLLEEWDLVKNAVFTDSTNQSAWFYNKWIQQKMTHSEEFIQDQVETCESIIEIDGECKWATLTILWNEMNSNKQLSEERLTFLFEQIENLIRLDPLRKNYYLDVKSDLLLLHSKCLQSDNVFKANDLNLTRFDAIVNNAKYENVVELDLSNNHIRAIPNLSSMKNLKRIILDHNKIEFLENVEGLDYVSIKNNQIQHTDEKLVNSIKKIDMEGNPLI
ncbi:rabggta, partial [Acrasis kona]